MGCDIHGVFQKQDGTDWEDIESKYEEDRHYLLFAWLGNVRNGFGFAGVRTHTPLAPLSDGRGFPAGFELVNGEDHGDIWMGDHSHTWLASDEILDAPDQSLTHSGIVTLKQFKNWDGVSEPESYSGGIWGPNVVTSSPDQITEATTHVQISWSAALLAEVKYFTDEVKRLVAEHGPIRFVFGFDS